MGMVLSATLLYYCSAINICRQKISIIESVIVIVLIAVVSFMMSLLINKEYFSAISILLLISGFLYVKSKNLMLSIISAILAYTIALLINNIQFVLLVTIFQIDASSIRQTPSLYVTCYIITFIIVYGLSKYLGYIIQTKLGIFWLQIKKRPIVIIITGTILAIALSYNFILAFDLVGISFSIFAIITTILVFFLLLFMITIYTYIINMKNKLKIKHKEELLSNLQNYTSNIESLYTEMRSFRHDYTNIISSLYGYIEMGDYEGLKGYFTQHIIPSGRQISDSDHSLDKLMKILIPEIKGLLAIKFIYAQELKINVYIEVSELIDSVNIDLVDIVRILGILLDNAIEESKMCENSIVRFAAISNGGNVMFIISNSYVEIPSLMKMYEKGFSTKGENRGIGLFNLKEIIGRYANVLIETEIKDNEFVQILSIYNL